MDTIKDSRILSYDKKNTNPLGKVVRSFQWRDIDQNLLTFKWLEKWRSHIHDNHNQGFYEYHVYLSEWNVS